VGRGDDTGVHAPFVPGRLEGVPDLVEAGPVAGLQGGGPRKDPPVGQGGRPVELDLGVVEVARRRSSRRSTAANAAITMSVLGVLLMS